MCGSQTLEKEPVKLKLTWRAQDVKDASTLLYLLRKAANKEWNQLRRKKFVAVNKYEKGVGDLKIVSLGDASTMGLRTAAAVEWINMSLQCYRGQS